MNFTLEDRRRLISENYKNMVTSLTDIYRQLLICILKNNQVVVDPNVSLSQVWELAEPYINDSNLKGSVLGLLNNPAMNQVLFAWGWVDASVKLYGGNLLSQISAPIQNSTQEQVKDKNNNNLQDFFEKVLVCLQDDSSGFENSSSHILSYIKKTLAKQKHYPWDTFLLKLAKASLMKDTLEIFGAVLILLEYAEKPEAKSILTKNNTNFKMEVVTHLKAVELSINDFLWRKADGDKLIYKHLIDLFTYLAKAQ